MSSTNVNPRTDELLLRIATSRATTRTSPKTISSIARVIENSKPDDILEKARDILELLIIKQNIRVLDVESNITKIKHNKYKYIDTQLYLKILTNLNKIYYEIKRTQNEATNILIPENIKTLPLHIGARQNIDKSIKEKIEKVEKIEKLLDRANSELKKMDDNKKISKNRNDF